MKTEIVCSIIQDKSIKYKLQNSPIWDNCCKRSELGVEAIKDANYIAYTIKFDGVTPVQVTKIEKLK